MPKVFLSPSTQEWNQYATEGNEELYMNLLADRIEPYLRSSGISFVRNDPARNVAGAIYDSNLSYYDVHLALHTNAAPELANNLRYIYPLPDKVRALPTSTLGEVLRTRAVSVLAELGYHDNYADEAWLKNNLESIARNIVTSLCDYFGIPFVPAGAVRTGTVTTDGSNLNIRSYPDLSGKIIGSMPDGAAVTINGETNGWYVVSYNGTIGYSSSRFITI